MPTYSKYWQDDKLKNNKIENKNNERLAFFIKNVLKLKKFDNKQKTGKNRRFYI